MKKNVSVLTLLLVFFVLIVSACEKQSISEEIVDPINDIKKNATFVEHSNGMDIYTDANGNKMYLPTNEKAGHGGSVLIGTNCDQRIERRYAGGGCYYFDCVAVGNSCKWMEIVNPNTGGSEYVMIICSDNCQ